MKWIETITPKQAAEELGVPYHGWMREMDRAWISEDQKYSVMSRLLRTEWGKVEHVTITAAEGVGRSDGSGDIPWAVKMEMRESKDHILPGGSAEAQRADMLRAMEAVSAKMAAERGITRQPLAVLSQSEISRRMSAI